MCLCVCDASRSALHQRQYAPTDLIQFEAKTFAGKLSTSLIKTIKHIYCDARALLSAALHELKLISVMQEISEYFDVIVSYRVPSVLLFAGDTRFASLSVSLAFWARKCVARRALLTGPEREQAN